MCIRDRSGDVSSGYRESGYLPEAVINFLALLGWNTGNDQELMSMDELVKLLSLIHISIAALPALSASCN